MLTLKVYSEENVVNDRYRRSRRYYAQKKQTSVSFFVGKLNKFVSVHTVFIFLRILTGLALLSCLIIWSFIYRWF